MTKNIHSSSSSRFIDITFHKIYTYTDMGEEFSFIHIQNFFKLISPKTSKGGTDMV